MPPRRSAGGPIRVHSRTSSGGSSKLGLNLQLTQKDPPPKFADKPRRNGHLHEPTTRTTSPHPTRVNSAHRIQTRDHSQAALRRAPTPVANPSKPPQPTKHKVGFTISNPAEGEEDDEWVSSESGAATPASRDSDADEPITPVQLVSEDTTVSRLNELLREDMPTPRGENPPPLLPRIESAIHLRQLPPAPPAHEQQQPSEQPAPAPVPAPITQNNHVPQPPSPAPKARSVTHSPPRKSPDPSTRRQAVTRPPSTHSINGRLDVPLRPHPLIRGHSYGAFAAKPAALAPLTTMAADAAPAQLSTASSSPSSMRTVSPTTSIYSASGTITSPTSPSSSSARAHLRRTSTSSTRSITALPSAPNLGASVRAVYSRPRTQSSQSATGHTFNALTSLGLVQRPTPSPPQVQHQSFSVRFPPREANAHLESIHPLLPPPYFNAHTTVLAHRNPIAESYDRVIRAKQAR